MGRAGPLKTKASFKRKRKVRGSLRTQEVIIGIVSSSNIRKMKIEMIIYLFSSTKWAERHRLGGT